MEATWGCVLMLAAADRLTAIEAGCWRRSCCERTRARPVHVHVNASVNDSASVVRVARTRRRKPYAYCVSVAFVVHRHTERGDVYRV